MSPEEVLQAFDGIRRAQVDGRYAPHKPLLLMLALARVQRGEARLTPFAQVEPKLKTLLTEFGPSNSGDRRHLPFWHLATDRGGDLWNLIGPPQLLNRPAGATPTLGELRQEGVEAGFSPEIHHALASTPGLLQQVARRILESNFPETLHADIAAEVGLDLEAPASGQEAASAARRRRDPGFREKVLRAYEYRCCVCGFDLRIGHLPAGLEGAHIQWHTEGGPDVEANGLCLCALHHKLFDLGAFTVEPTRLRIVFSQHAISGTRGLSGVLAHHGQPLLPPQEASLAPAVQFLEWNRTNVFKNPARA
jgi:putative restriction endonuclease